MDWNWLATDDATQIVVFTIDKYSLLSGWK